jgi:uncharacterized protein (TIGR02453 family)
MPIAIKNSTIDFLKKLSKNNDREWFNKNKDHYLAAYENVLAFVDVLLSEMRKHDLIETRTAKESLFRIYRDVRFSKDKSPYKTYWAGHFKRATKKLRGGYYFQIGPGETMAAGGFFNPDAKDLLRIRKDIDMNFADWKKMLANKKIVNSFGELKGDNVGTSPKGFSKDNPAIELLKHKQFYFSKSFTDKEILSNDFLKEMNQTFRNLRPYFDYMSDVLTTDANGVSLI